MSLNPDAGSSRINERETHPVFNGYSDIVDYILGITFEIWEQGQVERILAYYGKDIDVFSLGGVTHGASRMVEQTHATLKAFPDRLLLGEDVISSGNMARGFSSHRISSPMTNQGETNLGPATGNHVLTMNIADCEITQGRITREWLLRDNLALVSQLGFEPVTAALSMAGQFDDRLRNWLRQESERVRENRSNPEMTIGENSADPQSAFAKKVLENLWIEGDPAIVDTAYAPYSVMQRAPARIFSGRGQIQSHYGQWRSAFPRGHLSVDHVCSQPDGGNGRRIAIRWSFAANHEGPFAGLEPEGKPVYVVGATHWRVLGGRIITEWTVFDELALMAQILDQTV